MVINKLKCVFVHVPKTAGSSIEKVLYPNLSHISLMTDVELFAGWNPKNKIWMQHATMQQINDLYKRDLTGYFKFAFVRNPYQRAVSDWQFLQKSPDHQSKNEGVGKTFLNYLNRDGFFYDMFRITNDRASRIAHSYSQHDFIYDEGGNCLVDFIGRFENLQHDFDVICKKIGIPQQQLPHEKRQTYKHYTEYYDDETKYIVAERYAKDIEYFGYEFGE